jgi:O-antigen ligase
VAEVWSAVPWFRNFFLTYTAIEFVSIAFSDHITQSVIIFSQELVTCFGTFVVASYLFREKGRAEQFIGFICCMFSVLMVVGLIEHRMGDVPWAGHIPSFLQINDENVTRFLAGGERGGMHRVQTIFTTPLAFGELGALLFPFFLHFTFNRYAIVVRVLSAVGAAMVPVLMFFSQARVGTVGTFLSLLIYPTLVTLIGWRRAPTLLTSAIVFVSPVFMGIFGILIATVDGLRIRIFGGGATQMSTEARAEQWDLGLPKIEAHPWGYGIGEGASTVGYGNGWGVLTIDTSYLNILEQYGVVGLISYLGLLVAAPAYSFRSMMLAPREDRELQLFVPLTNTFLVFFMIKSSYAQAENAVLIYLLWGLAAALTWRLKQMSGQLNER